MQLKLDEILRATDGVRTIMIKLEELSDAELDQIERGLAALRGQPSSETHPAQPSALRPAAPVDRLRFGARTFQTRSRLKLSRHRLDAPTFVKSALSLLPPVLCLVRAARIRPKQLHLEDRRPHDGRRRASGRTVLEDAAWG
jgi:hypothetical protein